MTFVSEIGALVAAHSMGEDGSLKTFTVARTEAVLKLRASSPSEGVGWVLSFMQAMRCVYADMSIALSPSASGAVETLEIVASTEPSAPSEERSRWSPELVGLLSDGLREVPEQPDQFDADCLTQRLGAALNHLLATDPMHVELKIGGVGRRWVRRERGAFGREEDPYESMSCPPEVEAGVFAHLTVSRARGLGARLRALFGGGDAWATEVAALVRARSLGVRGEGFTLTLDRAWRPPTTIRMDGLGWFVPTEGEALWLVRGGVKILDLAEACEARGVNARAGMVYAPSVLTTTLGDAPRINEAFDAVVAWLDEATAGAELTSDGGGEAWLVHDPPTTFSTVGGFGRALNFERIERRVQRDGEIRFVWRHQARGGARLHGEMSGMDLEVLCCTPSEVAALRARLPPDTVIPHALVGRAPRRGSVQIEKLRIHSLDPVPLVEDSELIHRGSLGTVRLRTNIRAFIASEAQSARALRVQAEGYLCVTMLGREVIRLRGFDPGLVLWAELHGADALRLPSIAALEKDQGLLKELHRRARHVLSDVTADLMRRVLAEREPTTLPWLRHQLEEVGPDTLALAYETNDAGDAGLTWSSQPLLQVPVGVDEGGVVTAEALLRQVASASIRRPVEIVPGQAAHIYGISTARDPALAGILRVILPSSKLAFSMAEELWALPTAWSEPLGRRRMSREDVERALATSLHDPGARARLLTHFLISRVGSLEDFGLAKVRLFDRYDPFSKSPHSLLSFDEIVAAGERLPWVFPTAATRSLTSPVLCVTPGVAAFLGKLTAPPRVSRGRLFRPRVAAASKQRAGDPRGLKGASQDQRPPRIVERTMDMSLARGEVYIDGGDTPGIELWHGGLRVERVVLRGALGVVSGQVTVKTRVIPTEGPGREALVGVLRREAEPLVEALATFRLLASREDHAAASAEAAWDAMLDARDEHDSLALQRRLEASRSDPTDLKGGAEERALREVARIAEEKLPRGLWILKMLTRGFDVEPRTARFSKKLLEMGGPRHRDGKLTARLGLRHRWSRRVLGRGMSVRAKAPPPSAWELLVCTSLMISELGRWPELARRSSRHRRGRVLNIMVGLLSEMHTRDLSRDKP